jgi:hypothetical protein
VPNIEGDRGLRPAGVIEIFREKNGFVYWTVVQLRQAAVFIE